MLNCYLKITFCLFVLFGFVHKNQCNFVNNKSEILNIINYVHKLQQIDNNYEYNINKLKSTNYDNTTCLIEFINILIGLNNTELWALKVFDSWGKIPSGILMGNIYGLGNYDECINTSENVKGQYCLANIQLPNDINYLKNFININNNLLTIINNNNMVERDVRLFPQIDSKIFSLMMGICVPASCSNSMITYVLVELLMEYNISTKVLISEDTCSVKETVQWKALDIIVLCAFIIIVFLMVFCTIYDIIMTKTKRNKNISLLTFSIYTNGQKLLSIKRNKSNDVIECLNGIRVLSIVWVAYGHSHLITMLSPKINPIYLLEFLQTYYSMLLFAAPISVDSFFLLSGLLVSWSLLKYLDKSNGKLNWKNILWIYFHRYLRLTPPLLAAILFTLTFGQYIGVGPISNIIGNITNVNFCKEYWWSTLLYVQNYVNPRKMCLGHSWYLAVDMQLFLISPVLLYPLWKWKKRFLPVLIILILTSMAIVFTIFILDDFTKQFLNTKDTESYVQQQQKVYFPTHTRMGAWLVGIILGYVLHIYKGKLIKINKFIILFGWIVSLGSILAIVFGLYPMLQPNYPFAPLESAFYESFSRVSWSISLSWIIFVCVKGYGGPINTFLSLSIWQPFARLSYSIYIIHMIIQLLLVGSVRTTEYINDIVAIHRFWGDFGFSITIAIFWSLAFESPIVNLEKILTNFSAKKSISPLSDENVTNEEMHRTNNS